MSDKLDNVKNGLFVPNVYFIEPSIVDRDANISDFKKKIPMNVVGKKVDFDGSPGFIDKNADNIDLLVISSEFDPYYDFGYLAKTNIKYDIPIIRQVFDGADYLPIAPIPDGLESFGVVNLQMNDLSLVVQQTLEKKKIFDNFSENYSDEIVDIMRDDFTNDSIPTLLLYQGEVVSGNYAFRKAFHDKGSPQVISKYDKENINKFFIENLENDNVKIQEPRSSSIIKPEIVKHLHDTLRPDLCFDELFDLNQSLVVVEFNGYEVGNNPLKSVSSIHVYDL